MIKVRYKKSGLRYQVFGRQGQTVMYYGTFRTRQEAEQAERDRRTPRQRAIDLIGAHSVLKLEDSGLKVYYANKSR